MKAAELKEADFDAEVLRAAVPVLIDFWSPACGPCRALAPAVDRVAEEFGAAAKVFKVNIFDNMDLAQRLGIDSLPALLLFKEGREAARLSGVQKQETLSTLIKENL